MANNKVSLHRVFTASPEKFIKHSQMPMSWLLGYRLTVLFAKFIVWTFKQEVNTKCLLQILVPEVVIHLVVSI